MELLAILAELAIEGLCYLPWGGSGGAPPGKIRKLCAYCRTRTGSFVTCRSCRAPHHRDCAKINRRCAVYGCSNRKFLVPSA